MRRPAQDRQPGGQNVKSSSPVPLDPNGICRTERRSTAPFCFSPPEPGFLGHQGRLVPPGDGFKASVNRSPLLCPDLLVQCGKVYPGMALEYTAPAMHQECIRAGPNRAVLVSAGWNKVSRKPARRPSCLLAHASLAASAPERNGRVLTSRVGVMNDVRGSAPVKAGRRAAEPQCDGGQCCESVILDHAPRSTSAIAWHL